MRIVKLNDHSGNNRPRMMWRMTLALAMSAIFYVNIAVRRNVVANSSSCRHRQPSIMAKQ